MRLDRPWESMSLYGEDEGLEVSEVPIDAQIRLLPMIDRVRLCKLLVENLEAEIGRLG